MLRYPKVIGRIIATGDLNEYRRDAFIAGAEWQKKQELAEWSEEDKMIEKNLQEIENATWDIRQRLKSLRPPQYCENCRLKKSVQGWKPSEEQMKALQCAIVFMEIRKASDYDIIPLKSLYEDLKKL